MSLFLYRLGRWSAAHTWRVLGIWAAVLAILGVGALTLGSPLTSQISIPGTKYEKVLDQLGASIPEASGGFGTVVFRTLDGKPFTAAQQDAVKAVIADWSTIPHVRTVIDPFDAQAQADDGAKKLADAKAEIAAGEKKLADAKAQLDAAKVKLDQGKGYIAWAEKNAPDDPGLPAIKAQVADGEKQYQAGLREYEAGKATFDAGKKTYEQGAAVSAAMNGMRMVTEKGDFALAQVQFDDTIHSVPVADRDRIPAQAAAPLAAAGVGADYSVEITQDVSLVGPGEILGLMVAVAVLALMLGTLIAAGLPLLVALLGVAVGITGALALTFFYRMNDISPALALMLSLAVGIDYSLFIVNRHRGDYTRGMELHASIGRAVGTAGSAVTFAGMTVIIALAALVLSGIPLLAQMGLIAAATVAIAVLVALTVTPAVLAKLGPRVAPRSMWRSEGYAVPGDVTGRVVPEDEHEEAHGEWYVRIVTHHPWLTVLAVLGIVAVLAAPATQLRLGLPDGGSEPRNSTAYRTYDYIDTQFGPGMNGPIVAVATADGAQSEAQAAATQAQLATELAAMVDVRSVVPFGMSADRRTLAFQIVPQTGPAAERTDQLVRALLASADPIGKRTGTTIGYTGQTVANIEMSQLLGDALPGYLAVVVGLSILILLGVFRSLLVPFVATAGFLLSVAAAFGVVVAIYQWGWGGAFLGASRLAPILSFMPIILIGVLFGLAMDYQMFLVSGMREGYTHGEDARTAVRSGFVHGAKVVTAAALIMFSVFSGFVFSQLTLVRPIGLGLAIGVLVDAMLVRMTLTPAIMHLMGDRAWALPRWMDRIMPDLDVEGAKLTEHLAAIGEHDAGSRGGPQLAAAGPRHAR